MAEQRKAVLMMHIDQEQGHLWQTALATQQIEVIWEKLPVDIVKYLESCGENMPDLLIMDMAIKSPNSETLQSPSVCQWVTKQKVDLKVVLFNPRQDRIKDIERSWALRRGAADVLPRLSAVNLITDVARITGLIGCSFMAKPLAQVASKLGGLLNSSQSQTIAMGDTTNNKPDLSEPDTSNVVSIKSTTKNNSKTNATETSGAATYRGVRIRR